MKKLVKKIIYKLTGLSRNEILEKIDNNNNSNNIKFQQIFSELEDINLKIMQDKIDCKNLEILEGSEYSNFAIPLDYQPSRDLNPRWGYSKPIIKEIDQWFANYDNEYIEMLAYMKQLKLDHIPHKVSESGNAAWIGGAICPFDAMALYAMVMRNKPKHYVEIGSGMTTCFARQAVNDGNLKTKIISIDPQPRMEIENICDEIFRDGLEMFDINKLYFLEAGDILFFDGSHRTFMNSDVTVFFIDILPKLKPGVIVHLHDINLPYDYPHMFKNWYWNEQYMLAVCFLNGMEKINPLLPTTYICQNKKFSKYFEVPFVDLGTPNNEGWSGGGSMWFSYK